MLCLTSSYHLSLKKKKKTDKSINGYCGQNTLYLPPSKQVDEMEGAGGKEGKERKEGDTIFSRF